MLKISKSLAELLGFKWKKRSEFKDMLARPYNGKPSFHDYSGNRDPFDQLIEMSLLRDTYYTGDKACDLQRVFYSLFVYCDIEEDVVAGDEKADRKNRRKRP